MTPALVTCRKCGKVFDYQKRDGVCPKCARYYSTTHYNEEEALLSNILSAASEEHCSYHGAHESNRVSGHSENLHSMDGNAHNEGKLTVSQKIKAGFVLYAMILFIYFILSLCR